MQGINTGDILRGFIFGVGIFLTVLIIVALISATIFSLVKKTRFFHSLKIVIPWVVLLSYIIAFIYFTLLNRGNGMTSGALIIPFHSIPEEISRGFNGCTMLLASIIVGIPFGLVIPWALKIAKKWWITTLLTAIFALAIELIQLATGRGVFNIDDILFLAIGSCLGYAFYTLFSKTNLYSRLAMS